jgi:hypothetical protein
MANKELGAPRLYDAQIPNNSTWTLALGLSQHTTHILCSRRDHLLHDLRA